LDIEEAFLKEAGLSYVDYFDMLLRWHKNILTNPADRAIIVPEIKMSFIFNEVHDSIVVDLHPDLVKRDTEIIVETMKKVPSLHALEPSFQAPLDVDASIGPAWGEKES